MAKSTYHSPGLFYGLWGVATAIYFWITLTNPVTSNAYNLTRSNIVLLDLTLIIPIALIWLAAVFGAERFKRYAVQIGGSRDGESMTVLANGLAWLVYGTIANSLLSGLRSRFILNGRYVGFTQLTNYSSILILLIAFVIIFLGSRGLAEQVKSRSIGHKSWVTALVLLAGIGYIYLLLHNPYRNSTPDPALHQSYFLPDTALIASVILPYLVMWWFGLMAAVNVGAYLRAVKGTLYRQSLQRLVQGFYAVVITAIFFQFLGQLGAYFSGLNLQSILIFIYVIIAVYAVGFLLIASGARKLAKIEEV